MRQLTHRAWVAILTVAVIGVAGCDSANDPVQTVVSDSQATQTVQSYAPSLAAAAPVADTAGDLLTSLVERLGGTPIPMVAPGGAVAPTATCPETFDLGNGITGTCSTSESGTMTFVFGGSIVVDGASVSIEGSLVAGLSPNQPANGIKFDITYSATATGPRGTVVWSATGYVVIDDQHHVVDFRLDMNDTVTPAGGSSAMLNVIVTPGQFETTVTGPHGGTAKFVFDRSSMSGVVYVNGGTFANIEVVDGCANVDYTNPALTDVQICPQQQ